MSRKYRQRGYQDDDRPAPSRRGPSPRSEEPPRPRGRGLGAPTATVFRCSECGQARPLADPVVTESTCAGCGAPLHSCVHCTHFDTSSPNECRKPIPKRLPKAKANECEFFTAKTVQEFDSKEAEPDDPRAAFDALFK